MPLISVNVKKKRPIFTFFAFGMKKLIILRLNFKPNKKHNPMKKVLSIVAVAALSATFVACGPSKEEIEAREKQKADSIAAIEKQKQDSIAAAEADAAKKAEEAAAAEKMKQDSIAKADSLAKHAKGGKKH
jgi:hypothetical protein